MQTSHVCFRGGDHRQNNHPGNMVVAGQQDHKGNDLRMMFLLYSYCVFGVPCLEFPFKSL